MISVTNIYLAAIIHGALQIVVLVFNRRGNLIANRILALLIFLLMLSLWNILIRQLGLPIYWKFIDYNNWITPFLWGPVLYLYVSTICSNKKPKFRNAFNHCLLGIIMFVVDSVFYSLNITDSMARNYESFNNIRLLALYIQLAIYIFACIQLLKAYDERLRNKYSSIDSMSLAWLQKLVAIFAIILAVDMSLIVPAVLGHEKVPYFTAIMFAEAAAVFAIGYFSLIYTGVSMQIRPESGKSKYHGSPLDTKMSADLMAKLEAVMQETESYLNNNLRLSDLADQVGVNPHYLSQVINEQGDRNFYDFVNEYRAKRAAELLAADEKANITKVAFESGFNNRVSFNNAFKKYVGMTPSQYRGKSNGARQSSLQKRV